MLFFKRQRSFRQILLFAPRNMHFTFRGLQSNQKAVNIMPSKERSKSLKCMAHSLREKEKIILRLV